MTDLTGKTALITGSARGLGKAIALRYAALGANVVVNYASSREAADATVAEIERLGAKAIAVQADVSKISDIERLFAETFDHFGAVDIVVANAGVELIGLPIVDFTEDDFDHLYGINAKGTFFTLQAAARLVVDNGRIIYVGSSNTAYPSRDAVYGGSKIAAQLLTKYWPKNSDTAASRPITILPTAIDGAGVFSDADPNHPVRELIASSARQDRPTHGNRRRRRRRSRVPVLRPGPLGQRPEPPGQRRRPPMTRWIP